VGARRRVWQSPPWRAPVRSPQRSQRRSRTRETRVARRQARLRRWAPLAPDAVCRWDLQPSYRPQNKRRTHRAKCMTVFVHRLLVLLCSVDFPVRTGPVDTKKPRPISGGVYQVRLLTLVQRTQPPNTPPRGVVVAVTKIPQLILIATVSRTDPASSSYGLSRVMYEDLCQRGERGTPRMLTSARGAPPMPQAVKHWVLRLDRRSAGSLRAVARRQQRDHRFSSGAERERGCIGALFIRN
jgi:hypothetical protein